uniref:Uncharacterized protein n=1 Tax=Arundo donax TaxID=35708 RepID=A0A0A9B7L1_ARUDO
MNCEVNFLEVEKNNAKNMSRRDKHWAATMSQMEVFYLN